MNRLVVIFAVALFVFSSVSPAISAESSDPNELVAVPVLADTPSHYQTTKVTKSKKVKKAKGTKKITKKKVSKKVKNRRH